MRKIPLKNHSWCWWSLYNWLRRRKKSVWKWKAQYKSDTFEGDIGVEIIKSCVFCYERGLRQVVIQDQADTCVLCLFKSRLLWAASWAFEVWIVAEAGFTLLLAPTLAFFALLHLGQQVESPHQSPHSPHSLTFGPHTPPWLPPYSQSKSIFFPLVCQLGPT